MKNYNITIGGYTGVLKFGRYPNKRLAITLNASNGYGLIEVLTTNLNDIDYNDSFIILNVNNNLSCKKDKTIVDVFLEEGLIDKVEEYYQSGFVSYPKCKISNKLKELIKNNLDN